MELLPLNLHIKPDVWRIFTTRKNDPNFQPLYKAILERDQYACQFCGFQAMQHQEVINLDQNYYNNTMSNLATACCFCAQCFFLEMVGKADNSGGVLIYLPETPQGELNGFCHVLFCAIANGTDYREDAQTIYRNLKLRAQLVENHLGEGLSNPTILGQMLLDAPYKKSPELQENILAPLRLLPSQSNFSKQIEDWAQSANEELNNIE